MSRLLAALVSLAAASQESSQGGALSFLAIGDWGGGSDAHPTTPGETCTASGMGRVATQLGAQFVLALGDNFYDSGIHFFNKGRFASTFEDVFTDKSLDVDWYVVAGNHDHKGNVQDQIDYAKKSTRWKFPATHYTFTKTLPSGKVAQFVMFDSLLVAGMSYHNETTGEFVAAPGPSDPEVALGQLKWIEDTLKASTADYLFTAAHYPVWSACSHGPTDTLVRQLRPLLSKYQVTAHLAGHDHCLEHVEDGSVYHILSGAGSKAWYPLDKVGKLEAGVELKWHMARDNKGNFNGGFASVTLTDEAATVMYHGDDGTLAYTSAPKAPRSGAFVTV